jgi:HupE / UreJ protein
MMLRAFALAVMVLASVPAVAHKASDGYLTIEHHGEKLDLRLDLALRDLDNAIGLDADGDGAITWGELRARHAGVAAYAKTRLAVSSAGEQCSLDMAAHEVDRHTDAAYAVLRLAGRCASQAPVIGVDYRLLFDVDPTHRGLVRYVAPDGGTKSLVLSADHPNASLSSRTSTLDQAVAYLVQGARHIGEGFDHLLFLLSLLLPAVLVWKARAWAPVASFRSAFIDVAKIVTAFTVAHSITLTLAVIGVIALPSRLVESAIALSVVLAAANNLWPVVGHGRMLAAFGFGLIHGFGFAGALGELGLPDDALALSLASFNIGVELGQLAVVAVFLPLAFALRATTAYRSVVLKAGSAAIVVIAMLWFVERAFDIAPLAVVLPG